MDIPKDQLAEIRRFIGLWFDDSNLELETSFGEKQVVDSNTFLQIAQRLRTKGFRVIPQNDYLNIIIPNRMRITINGLGIISQYCQDNTLQDKAFTVIIKDSKTKPIDVQDYNLRFKLQNEEVLNRDDGRVADLMKRWHTEPKAFRVIRRWSFEGKGIRVDMSMIRQSATDPEKKQFRWTKSYLDANISKQMVRYEVEVELLHNTEHTQTPENSLRSLIIGAGEVLRGIQRNSLLITNTNVQRVRSQYKALMKGADSFRGVNPITLEMDNVSRDIKADVPNIRDPTVAVDSESDGKDLAESTTLKGGYNVTDKADGMRTMGFVNDTGELFLLDQSMNVYRTDLRNDTCKNTLLDGEWVTQLKDNSPVNRYLLFDIYVYNGMDVSDKPFIAVKEDATFDKAAMSRYTMLQTWFETWSEGLDGPQNAERAKKPNVLQVICKEFRFAVGEKIFEQCRKVLNEDRLYNTDGLILTSNVHPLPKKFGKRFNFQFKWKPSSHNSIDFLVSFDQEDGGDKVNLSIDPSTLLNIQYKTMRLYVAGMRSSLFDNPRNTILSQAPLQDLDRNAYRPILFFPLENYDSSSNICNRLIEYNADTGEDYIITEETREPLQNNSIVEMRYEPNQEPGWRWIPTRVRHDKTERLHRAQEAVKNRHGAIKYYGMMNDVNVANSVWNSIHDPITEHMISTGNENPVEEVDEKADPTDMTQQYYQRKTKNGKKIVQALADFHNQYIKENILIKSALEHRNLRLLDIACGVGGDLYKWKNAGASYVMGIDIASDNINDANFGAYKRYLEVSLKFGKQRMPKIAFAVGDSSKPIVTGEAASSALDRDIMCTVFGKTAAQGQVPSYISEVMKNSFRDGADAVACMFAIHYFFKDMDSLNGLLKNLADTVKVGGYFIGCCFDGNAVFNLLKDTDTGAAKVGLKGNNRIWSITKKYTADQLDTTDAALGLPIDVEFITIGGSYTEYLVPFELLVAKMQTIGLTLHQSEMFETSYAKALSEKQKFNMSDAEKQYSFLNRWFIFKRTGVAMKVNSPFREFQEFPLLPNEVFDKAPYMRFSLKVTKADPTYADYIAVRGSEYSCLMPWQKKDVAGFLERCFPNRREVDVIVDATANIGIDSIHMSQLFPNATVHSFEIVNETFMALCKNIDTCKKHHKNCKIIPYNLDVTTWVPTKHITFLFVDPPWGGKDYDKNPSLELYLQAEGAAPDESKNVKTLIKTWLTSGFIEHVILKAPPNFNKDGLPSPEDVGGVMKRYTKTAEISYRLIKFSADKVRPVKAVMDAVEVPVEAPVEESKEDFVPIDLGPIEEPATATATENATAMATAEKPIKPFLLNANKGRQNGVRAFDEDANLAKWSTLNAPLSDAIPVSELPVNAALWLQKGARFNFPQLKTLPDTTVFSVDALVKHLDTLKTLTDSKPVSDKIRPEYYSSVETFLTAMKYIYASNYPLFSKLMSYAGVYAQIAAKKGTLPPQFTTEYFDRILEDSKYLKKFVTGFKKIPETKADVEVTDAKWNAIEDLCIEFAINYRFAHDQVFINIIKSLAAEGFIVTCSSKNASTLDAKIAQAINVQCGLFDAADAYLGTPTVPSVSVAKKPRNNKAKPSMNVSKPFVVTAPADAP